MPWLDKSEPHVPGSIDGRIEHGGGSGTRSKLKAAEDDRRA